MLEIAELNSKTSNNSARLVVATLVVSVAKLIATTLALSVTGLAVATLIIAIIAAPPKLACNNAYKSSKVA
jgi:hypothetical protein